MAALHLPTLARLGARVPGRPRRRTPAAVARTRSPSASALGRLAGSTNSSPIPRSRSSRSAARPASTRPQILASVAAGKRAIFCEKPVGTTVAEARARRRGVPGGRHPADRRHQPLLRPGVGQGEAPPHRDRRPRRLDLGDPRAAAERALPRRRDGARACRRSPLGTRPRPARDRRGRRSPADHRARDPRSAPRARPRAAIRARRVRAGARRRSATRSASSRAASRCS